MFEGKDDNERLFKTNYLESKFRYDKKKKLRRAKANHEKQTQFEGLRKKFIKYRGVSLDKKVGLKMFDSNRVKSFEIKKMNTRERLPLLSGRNSDFVDFNDFDIQQNLHDVILVEKYLRFREKMLKLRKEKKEFGGSSTMIPDED